MSINVRLTPEEANKLGEIAMRNRISKSEMLRLCFVNQNDDVTFFDKLRKLTERLERIEAQINPQSTH